MTRSISRAALWAFAVAVCVYLLAPAVIVVPLSFNASPFLQFPPTGYTADWYRQFFADPDWVGALMLSLRVGALSAVLATIVGGMAAYVLARHRVRFHRVLDGALALPLIVPVVVFGVGLYSVQLTVLPAGTSPELLLVLAHTVLAMPYVVLYVGGAFKDVDWLLERAARSCGASPGRAFWTVIAPQVWPGVVAGALLAFVLSLDETVVALFVTDGSTQTLPARMFTSISYELNPLVPVAATVMLGTMAALGLLYLLVRGVGTRLKGRWSVDPG